jgi:hypothetical protein
MQRSALLLATLFFAQNTAAQDPNYPAFDLGGLLFGDAYVLPSHHLDEGDGAAGFVLRRGYLTLDVDFSERWYARARVELNQEGDFETYEYDADWKDLYIGLNLGEHTVQAGLTSPPTFDLIEKTWGARYLMRTPMDLQGVASRDTGLLAKGPLNASGTLAYRAMWAAAVDFGKDGNPNDRLMAAISWSPGKNWTLDVYADTEDRDDQTDRTTWQVFLGNRNDQLRWGLQYSKQDREDDPPLELASGFLGVEVGEDSTLIGRIDRLIEPSPRGDGISYIPFDPSAPATLYVAAYEYQMLPNLAFTPNVVVIDYDRADDGYQAETDVHLRLTAFFTF